MVDEFPKKIKLLRFRITYFMPRICAAARDIQTIQPILYFYVSGQSGTFWAVLKLNENSNLNRLTHMQFNLWGV